jgi:hypothetical protein
MPITPAAYLYASTAVGLAQVADAAVLLKYKERVGALATVFSLAEYGWAIFSYLVWRSAEPPFPIWLPITFIAYVLSFMSAGIFLAAVHRGDEKKVMPNHLVVAGGLFGAAFAGLSFWQAITSV